MSSWSRDSTGTATVVDHVRLFRNDPRICWRYRVHEQILPAVREVGGQVRATDVAIEHTGYIDAGLKEGAKMISNLLGVKPNDITIGMPVRVVFEDITDEVTLPKFVPR